MPVKVSTSSTKLREYRDTRLTKKLWPGIFKCSSIKRRWGYDNKLTLADFTFTSFIGNERGHFTCQLIIAWTHGKPQSQPKLGWRVTDKVLWIDTDRIVVRFGLFLFFPCQPSSWEMAVGYIRRWLVIGVSSAGLTPFKYFFTPLSGSACKSLLLQYYNLVISIAIKMVKIYTSLLAVTLVTGSALASSSDYER